VLGINGTENRVKSVSYITELGILEQGNRKLV